MRSGSFTGPASLPNAQLGIARKRWGEPLAYEQGLLYLWQACRRGGWWFSVDDVGMALVAKDYSGPGEHEVIVPLAPDIPRFFNMLRSDETFQYLRPGKVRHVPSRGLEGVRDLEFLRAVRRAKEAYDGRLEDLSEDRFPQVIAKLGDRWIHGVDTGSDLVPVLPTGHGYAELRYQVRRFVRDARQKAVEVGVRSLSAVGSAEVHAAIRHWMGSLQERYSKPGRPEVADFSECFRRPVEVVIDGVREFVFSGGVGELAFVEGKPRGGWAGAWVSSKCFGVYILFADTGVRGLSEFIMYRAGLYALISGYQFVNLGGSELDSLYSFKRKMAPEGEGGTVRELSEFAWRW